uniref:Tartrate-resistant acid phosphatase type 5 n=1 Tax=Arion vulgaris TaxID=1028688 RepID=A0A0B6ZW14_9EUPU
MALSLVVCFAIFFLPGSYGVESLRFFIIGDVGGVEYEPYSTLVERSTATEMGKIADIYSPQFILELGDNFYHEGVTSVNDKRFNLTFEDVFTATSLQVPWYLIAGNHDHYGNVTAQILYSKYSKRWNFPNLYYYKEFMIPNTDLSVGFVFIDTIQLCGNTDDFLIQKPRGPVNQLDADQQWAFVKQSLNKSRASYLFVAGHYPVYSVAEHGPTDCLVEQLQPMLNNYMVNGYMSGHDHNLQHLQVKSRFGSNIDYFVSGMANFVDNSTAHMKYVPHGSLQFHYGNIASKGGFLYAEATANNITFTFINSEGQRLYSTIIYPRKL